jgi:glycosyltransferase involved in cell wall biosynthesis
MRIGIDARELGGHATGVGRYLSGLLQAWAHDPTSGAHQFMLYATEPLALELDGGRFATRIVAGAGGTWWEQIQLPPAATADKVDVLFSPAYTSPLFLGMPSVVAIHDVSFVAHPEWFTAREGLRRRWLTAQTAARASCIVTISEFSRSEIVDRLGVPPGLVVVIPPGILHDVVAPPDPVESTRRETSFPAASDGNVRRPLVLYVGSIFTRRHVPDLVRAFAPLSERHPEITLELVGDNRSYPHQDLLGLIASERLGHCATWRSYLPDDGLRELYRSARAFAFLSEYEGLGLTPLEALAWGIPPVLLDTPVARESCGPAALYVAPGDQRAVTNALEALLFNESVRTRILAAAPAVLARYNWAVAARDTLAAIVGAV